MSPRSTLRKAARAAAPAKQTTAPAPKAAKAIGRPPKTPNLAAQKAKRADKVGTAVPVTAEEIRKLPYNHPGRLAYMLNGVRGWENYLKSC